MEKIISIENASYYYKAYDDAGVAHKVVGIENVNLDIYEGEFLAVVGHNGSGKSTLAKLLNALIVPKSGAITVNGLCTADKNNIYEIRKTVGMVFQNPDNQMVASIVEEDVAFGPENLGIPQKEIIERVTTSLAMVDMSDAAKRSPHKLSGGQKQRIAIAGALAIRPRVLVLDESTAMLDPAGRQEVLNVAKTLNKQLNMTIILITHFMEEAESADRVVVMNKGTIAAIGTPKEIFLNGKLIDEVGLALPRVVELNNILRSYGLPLEAYTIDEQILGEVLCQLL